MILTREIVRRAHLLDDDVLEHLPLISTHDGPQPSPQEYECGCVTVIIHPMGGGVWVCFECWTANLFASRMPIG